VRVAKSLHAALATETEAEGVSLNQLVVAKLAVHLQVR
jgi:predicted HicB family RNase H-like nuclease